MVWRSLPHQENQGLRASWSLINVWNKSACVSLPSGWFFHALVKASTDFSMSGSYSSDTGEDISWFLLRDNWHNQAKCRYMLWDDKRYPLHYLPAQTWGDNVCNGTIHPLTSMNMHKNNYQLALVYIFVLRRKNELEVCEFISGQAEFVDAGRHKRRHRLLHEACQGGICHCPTRLT